MLRERSIILVLITVLLYCHVNKQCVEMLYGVLYDVFCMMYCCVIVYSIWSVLYGVLYSVQYMVYPANDVVYDLCY
jgi:hypothetical protein